MTSRSHSLLAKLNLSDLNPGVCSGVDGWINDPNGDPLVSYNPTTGEAIAAVSQATPAAYEQVICAAQEAFLQWRMMPAPKRGLVVRDLGNALRDCLEPLGELRQPL